MQMLYATEATPGSVNEDFVMAGPTWAFILDGATRHPDANTGCIHDVPWFVSHLGVELARSLATSGDRALDDELADAIAATRRLHEHTCDLDNADSPSATAVVVRAFNGRLDYLTLADSPFVVDVNGHVEAITDDRTAHLSDYSVKGVCSARNRPGGFYVASTQPEAAYEAVRGSLPTADIRSAALLSDGGARLVERFRIVDWQQLLDMLIAAGPEELIRQTRAAERAESDSQRRGRRGKTHDDATAVLMTHLQDV